MKNGYDPSKGSRETDHTDSHDFNYLGPEPTPQLATTQSAGEQAEKMVSMDLHDVPLTLEQIQAAEGILRSWLIQSRGNNRFGQYDLGTMGMLQTIQSTQNVFADFLNAYYAALAKHEALAKEAEEKEAEGS